MDRESLSHLLDMAKAIVMADKVAAVVVDRLRPLSTFPSRYVPAHLKLLTVLIETFYVSRCLLKVWPTRFHVIVTLLAFHDVTSFLDDCERRSLTIGQWQAQRTPEA
jgi:hypothetical protein